MALYAVTYRRPGRMEGEHRLEAVSDAQARILFLNLDWVAFEDIEIISIEPAAGLEPIGRYNAYRPRRVAVVDHSRRMGKTEAEKARKSATSPPGFDWRAECDRLDEQIINLSDAAQACERAGKHRLASAKRAKVKELADQRSAIIKRSKGK